MQEFNKNWQKNRQLKWKSFIKTIDVAYDKLGQFMTF